MCGHDTMNDHGTNRILQIIFTRDERVFGCYVVSGYWVIVCYEASGYLAITR